MQVDFGIFMLMQQRNMHKSSYEILQDAVELTRVADELGFGAAWFAEHHFNNYGLCASPLVMAAHCAAVTKRIRLGPGIVVAPLYQPMRLIAEVAMVDQLSNGRLNLGIGSGYQQFEFERFGTSLQEAKARTLEIMDMLELGLKQPRFSYEGRFYRQPSSAISQRPLQQPMPPFWITSTDPTFVRRAARDGHHLFLSGAEEGLERLLQARRLIDGIAAEEGRQPGQMRVGMLRAAFASDDDAELERYLDCTRYRRRVSRSLATRTAQIADDYQVAESPLDNEPSFAQMKAGQPVGPVERVIERVVQDIRAIRPCHYVFHTQVGDFEHRTMLRQLELWGTHIIPAVRRELARDAAPAEAAAA